MLKVCRFISEVIVQTHIKMISNSYRSEFVYKEIVQNRELPVLQ